MDSMQPQPTKWYYSVASVFVALFLLGPLAFPLLWKSPRFSLTWKILLTVIITAATVYCIAATWNIIRFVLEEFKRAGLM